MAFPMYELVSHDHQGMVLNWLCSRIDRTGILSDVFYSVHLKPSSILHKWIRSEFALEFFELSKVTDKNQELSEIS